MARRKNEALTKQTDMQNVPAAVQSSAKFMRAVLAQVTAKGSDVVTKHKSPTQKQRTEAIYRQVFNVEANSTIDPFALHVTATGATVSFDAPALATFFLCVWKLVSNQPGTSDVRNYQVVFAVEKILDGWNRFENINGYRSITAAAVEYLIQTELMVLGEEEYHDAVLLRPAPAGWKVIEAEQKAMLATPKKRFKNEDDAWPWPSKCVRLADVVLFYTARLGKSSRTLHEWATLCGWSRNMPKPDGRSEGANKEIVLKTLREKRLID